MSTKILSALLGLSLFGCTETAQQVRPGGGDMRLHGWPATRQRSCSPEEIIRADKKIEHFKQTMRLAKKARDDARGMVSMVMSARGGRGKCDELRDALVTARISTDAVFNIETQLPSVTCATEYAQFASIVHDRANNDALEVDALVNDAQRQCLYNDIK